MAVTTQSWSVAVIAQFPAPTGLVALGTAATTISTAQIPAVSLGSCDIVVKWGNLSLGNTATAAVSYTLSATIGGSLANLNGLTPNGFLAAASAGGSVTTAYIETHQAAVNTNAPFTCTLSGLGSAAGINAYLRINGTVSVEAYVPGVI